MSGIYKYDSDGFDIENPLISEEARYWEGLGNAIARGTAYEEYGYDPDGTAKERRQETHMEYDPGIYTRTFRGSTYKIGQSMSYFHRIMQEKYNNYRVIDTAPIQLADSSVLYLTFSVGNRK